MNANWITATGNPDVFPAEVAGRRFMVLTLGVAAVALSGCEAWDKDVRQSVDNDIQHTEYYQDRDAGVCYAETGQGATTSRPSVECTPQVLAKIAEREKRDQ